jgi:molybdopterin biosynthesis enzyme
MAVSSSGAQGSHQLYAMARANALAVTPPDAMVSTGDIVDVIVLD